MKTYRIWLMFLPTIFFQKQVTYGDIAMTTDTISPNRRPVDIIEQSVNDGSGWMNQGQNSAYQ